MKKNLFKSFTILSLLAALALIFSAIGVTPAHAATLTVTNLNDSGAGSLRQAIEDAAPDNTITFDSSLSGGTIHLASTLTLSKNVTIDGSALASQITISGDTDDNGTGDVQVFYVNAGVTATLNSLTITKGYTSGDGGGIYNNGTLTLTATRLTGGDVNDHISNDRVINIGDATLLTVHFGEAVPPVNPPIELTQADINGDGIVNVQDLAILGSNYGLSGEQPW